MVCMNKSNAPASPKVRYTAEQMARLVEISLTLNSTLDLEVLLQFIIRTAAELLDCEAASILLFDEDNKRLFFAAATGSDSKKLAEIPVPLENSLAGTVFRENRYLALEDVQRDSRHYPLAAKHVNFEVHSLLGVPMRIKDQPTGVLEALNKRSGNFCQADVDILSAVAAQAAVAVHNARLVKALQDAYEELRTMDKIKSDFLAVSSHELRTPLGIIFGYATFLKEEAEGEMSEHAERLFNATLQLRSLVESMTNLNMLRTKEWVLHKKTIPIQQILRTACNEILASANAKKQKVIMDFPEQPLKVSVDAEKMILIFVNLLNNAVRFTETGGQITLGARLEQDFALAWVEDTGSGIPPEELRNIFQEFYQVEPHMTRRQGGLGIGLTITQGLIEIHDGRIWAESEGPGKGSCFKVLLPLAESAV